MAGDRMVTRERARGRRTQLIRARLESRAMAACAGGRKAVVSGGREALVDLVPATSPESPRGAVRSRGLGPIDGPDCGPFPRVHQKKIFG